MKWKDRLKEILTEEELALVRTAYDHVGGIAIIDIPDELVPKEKEIAQALIDSIKTVTTVLKKTGIHEGEFRTQPLKYLAGEETKVAQYVELGTRIRVNVETVYFSPRLSEERRRIMEMIDAGEKVLVLFSGCGIYPVVFSRNTRAEKIVGIEINPEGHKYGLENIQLNKCKNVELFNGDVCEVVKDIGEKFDRIVMPLPKSAFEFLPDAFKVAKKGAILHVYGFEEEKTMPAKTEELIKSMCKEHGFSCSIIGWSKCGNHKPYWYRICVDVKI